MTCPEWRYHLLRAASERFQTAPRALDAERLAQVERLARKTLALENQVLATSEARDTQIPESQLAAAVAAIQQRYDDTAAFLDDLENNGLDENTLQLALRRELIFDAVMQQVGARAEAVSAVDEQLFYELQRDRFARPERRTARHILLTINAEFAENQRDVALARIERIAAQLQGQVEQFGTLASQHSECPTAMQQGQLGTLPRGQLYPALDAALFALAEGEISGVVESELGFHLLLCEQIEPAELMTFAQVQPQIHVLLQTRRQREYQKSWLAQLSETKA
ncbi:nitrogen fixation protein NifM [Chromatium okenii]|uniref:nitrogen fixation protein NifM n=1 Tax=Chromatium okenii TaxID=61644 RepID=UPI0026F23DC7|nr:nitrogen fixation protein NifM [Chromatium okenii]MBV5309904.1 nitrogen fixation protein NifM [Chromatium okenii]